MTASNPQAAHLTVRRSEAPTTSLEILRRLARFATRVVDAPIAHVVVSVEGREVTASAGLEELAARRDVHCFVERLTRLSTGARRPSVEDLECDVSAAGIPLVTSTGAVVGALGIADTRPREWTPQELELLEELAAMVATEVELRETAAAVTRLVAESEERRDALEAVVEASPLAILTVNREGNVETWNRAAERIFGWTAEEVIGRPSPAVPDELAVECGVVREQALRAETVNGMETLRRRKDGAVLNVSLSTAALHDADGEIVGVLAILDDITDRIGAQEALRASEARKSAILESSLDCVITIDHTGTILEWNPAAERTFGYRRSDALRKTVADLIVPRSLRASHALGLARYLVTGESNVLGRRFETTAMRSDGSEFSVELALTRVDISGPPVFTAFARDLTERRQAEEALRRSEEQRRQAQKLEAIGRVAGSIAHDFNNLIIAIRGYAELLAVNAKGQAQRDAAEIVTAADRATALVRQLLAFSRGERLEPSVFDLNDVVRNIEPLLRQLAGEAVEVVTTLDPALQPLTADASKLEQVIVNLVVNARDAMPNGGRVTIETRAVDLREPDPVLPALTGNLAQLTVSDNGVGMDAEAKARAFEPFFTTKASRGGTGLGLATVYGIVTQSGGRITVDSEPGTGTQFAIHLPSRRRGQREPAPPRLTPRQHEVLGLLAQGLSTKAIAARLVCAETTVRNHVNAVMVALGAHSRLEAVLKAQNLGLV